MAKKTAYMDALRDLDKKNKRKKYVEYTQEELNIVLVNANTFNNEYEDK